MARVDFIPAATAIPLDLIDEINMRLNKAIGIVDLLGNDELGSMDDGSRNNASWAAKDLLKEVMRLVNQEAPGAGEEGGAA